MAELAPALTWGEFGDPLLDDLRNFTCHVFRRTLGADPTRIQYAMADFLQQMFVDPSYKHRFIMLEALRGEGKSLLTSILAPWLIWRDFVGTGGRSTITEMVVSGTKDRADNFAYYVKQLFDVVPELRPMIPRDPDRWANTSFDIEGAVVSHMPTFTSRGVFGRMTGDRAHAILFDDIEIPQNSETQGQKEKLRRRVPEFLDLLVPGGILVGLGTPQDEDTIYADMEEWGFEIRMFPAEYPTAVWMGKHGRKLAPILKRDMEDDPTLVGQPIDPERFDAAELQVKKAGGASRYALQYMLDTSQSDALKFPLKVRDLVVLDFSADAAPADFIWSGAREHIRPDLPALGMGGDTFQSAVPVRDAPWVRFDHRVMALDPAGRGADETGLAVVNAAGANLYWCRSRGLQGGYEEDVRVALIEELERWKPHELVYEDNFGDEILRALLGRWIREAGLQVSLVPVRNLNQKEVRIIDSLEPVMNQHRLAVMPEVVLEDRPGRGDHPDSFRVFRQMTRLSKARGALLHYDRLDALAIAVRHLTTRMNLTQSDVLRAAKERAEDDYWRDWWSEVIPDPIYQATPAGPQNRGLRR